MKKIKPLLLKNLNSGAAIRKHGLVAVKKFSEDERIVGMTIFQDRLYVATTSAVYVKTEKTFRKVYFEIAS
jgi:hypothetical protein